LVLTGKAGEEEKETEMKSYETEFKGTFITVRKDAYGLDAVLTYPELGFEISDQENTDELFSRVFDSIEAGETLARAIRLTSAVIVRVKERVGA
jgi:hypothetical protein